MKKASSNSNNLLIWIVVSVILLLLMILLFVVIRNQKQTPVYLKPKNGEPKDITAQPKRPVETYAEESSDVKRSELNSLRQSAVSMSVGQKDGATQIVKDWLETESSDSSDDAEAEEEN